jgi:hypothetical protein
MKLVLEIGEWVWPIRCDVSAAPKTLSALAAILPLPLRLQTPKIAGAHIYWQAPLLCDLEAGSDIMRLAPGAFLYWPERQFLEILFAPLQAETASVTALGALEDEDHVTEVAHFGETLRETAGVRPSVGVLKLNDDEDALPLSAEIPRLSELAALHICRTEIWEAPPPELTDLIAGRGILHPAGPVLFAESEARGLHEMLWWMRRDGNEVVWRGAAPIAIDKAAARLGGFCHLASCAEVLTGIAELLRSGKVPACDVIDEAILYLGGLSAWLDTAIPWNAMNEAFRQATASPKDLSA